MDNTHMDKNLKIWKNMDNFYEKNMVKKKTYALDGTLKIAENQLPPFHRGNFGKNSRINCVVFHTKCSTKEK